MSRRSLRPAALAIIAAGGSALPLAACDANQPERLASRCARAAPELRVTHLASLMTSAKIAVTQARVAVTAEVPVGIGIDARPRFRLLEYACTRHGDRLEFDSYRVTSPDQ